MPNETYHDAYRRVSLARDGFLHKPTLEYLRSLRKCINAWLEVVDREIRVLEKKGANDGSQQQEQTRSVE